MGAQNFVWSSGRVTRNWALWCRIACPRKRPSLVLWVFYLVVRGVEWTNVWSLWPSAAFEGLINWWIQIVLHLYCFCRSKCEVGSYVLRRPVCIASNFTAQNATFSRWVKCGNAGTLRTSTFSRFFQCIATSRRGGLVFCADTSLSD